MSIPDFEVLAKAAHTMPTVYVSTDRTVLVQVWDVDTVSVSTRESSERIWGPPVSVRRES